MKEVGRDIEKGSYRNRSRNTITVTHFKCPRIVNNIRRPNNSFLFNKTFGYSELKPKMNTRAFTQDNSATKEMKPPKGVLPKVEGTTNKDYMQEKHLLHDNPSKSEGIQNSLKYQTNSNDKINEPPSKASKIQMKSTLAFSNLAKVPMRFKIKPNPVLQLDNIVSQSNAIININQNIQHNIHINVTPSPDLTLNKRNNFNNLFPNNFKTIKITQDKTPNDLINNKQKNSLSIISNDSVFFSQKSSFISKPSCESIPSFQVKSSHSSIKEQEASLTLAKENKIADESGNTQGKRTIDKEDFKRFCIDFNSKLSNILVQTQGTSNN